MDGLIGKLLGGGDLAGQAAGLFGGQVPDLAGIASALGTMPMETIQSTVTGAVGGLSPDTLASVGGQLAGFLETGPFAGMLGGIDLQAVAAGDPGSIGAALGPLLQQQGLGVLPAIFADGGAASGGIGGAIGGLLQNFGIGGSAGGVLSLAQIPQARELLGALLPALANLGK